MAPSTLRPPTTVHGYTDESSWQYALSEVTEHIPQLQWPLSIPVFAELRHDPQLTAIHNAYTLPIRRASWSVDPAGCRDEVVQMVADDLGIPVKGVDKPGAARTRGVSWPDHLRMALQCLPFGHSCFEMEATVTKKQARLTALYERMQSTISWIYVGAQGQLDGISQTGGAGPGVKPQITADRLVWYANEREGGGWQGNSLFRPSYAAYILKREAMRILATSHRRFGMGVPTIEWATGSAPTPGQMDSAQQIAQSARVTERGGVALPPGARLVLTGMTGSAPDTLGFLRWLDQQMAGSVLAQWMTLGESTHGSRALGEAFLDAFLLSLQATADFIADQVTRQVSARVVAWNWGDDEPVPAVHVADVGVRHEVTAEALNQLVTSGALESDPALDAYIRATFRLPQRDPNTPWTPRAPKALPPSPAAPEILPADNTDGTDTGDTGKVAAAARPARRRRRREPSDDQLEFPLAAATPDPPQRELTPQEKASGADFQEIRDQHDEATAALVAAFAVLGPPIAVSLVLAVGLVLASGGVAALGTLRPDPGAVAALGDRIASEAVRLAGSSATLTVGELAHVGLPVTGVSADLAAVMGQAHATAAQIAQNMASVASRTALLHTGPASDPDTVAAAVKAALTELDQRGGVAGSLSSMMLAAQHAGRIAAFQVAAATYGDGAVSWVASEVNDRNQCLPCHEADGRSFATFADALALYPNGRNIECLGRDRCRGVLLAVPAGKRR